MDLSTNYLGLKLKHPLVAGASPLVDHLDKVRELEDAGAAAIVMHSLFEEQITQAEEGMEAHVFAHEEAFAEATTYLPRTVDFALGPEQYLDQIGKIKRTVSCPVIASLNGRNLGGWVKYAEHMETAGADAIELNLYFQPTSDEVDSVRIERDAAQIVAHVCQAVKIPVAVKLSPYFTSLTHFVRSLSKAGADGVVLFNRFYQPDIDIEELVTTPNLKLSTSDELLLRLRWLSIFHDRYPISLACSGGVHTSTDVIKALMAGADCVQMVSALLQHGPQRLGEVRRELEQWMTEFEYESVSQMKGSMSYKNTPNPEAIERANYMKILQSWRP